MDYILYLINNLFNGFIIQQNVVLDKFIDRIYISVSVRFSILFIELKMHGTNNNYIIN